MIKLRTENAGLSGKETLMGFDAGTGTLRIERLAPHLKDLDAVLSFACLDDNGNKCRLGYEPSKSSADRGEPGKFYFYDAEGRRTQIRKLDLTAHGCPKKGLTFKHPADMTVEVKQGTDITIRGGMKLDLHVRTPEGKEIGVARGLTFDDNPDPYVLREDMSFNTKELMAKVTEIVSEGYTLNMTSGKEEVNIGPFEVLSGKGVHSYLSFEKENGEKRSLFIDNKLVRPLSLSAARRNERYEMKKAEKYAAVYRALEPECRNRRERELIQRHIFAGDDIMGISITDLANDPSEAVKRMKIYHDSSSMVLSFTKNLGVLSPREKKALMHGGDTHDLSEAIRKLSEMTVRLDGHDGTDGYRLVMDGALATDTVLHDDGFEHLRGGYKDSYESQRRELLAKFSCSFADTVEKDNFKELAGYCREHGLDLLESARVTENESLLWNKLIEKNDPVLFADLLNSSPSLRNGKEVPVEVAASVFNMMKEGRFELDAPGYRKTNVLNAVKRASLFFETMSAPETNLKPSEVAELTEAYLEGSAELTSADIHKLASAEGVRRVDAIKDYLLTGDEKLLEGHVAYKGRYVQEMMEKFLEKATTDGVKRASQDPESAGFTYEVITDPLELVNEFNNTNRMGCCVTSLGDGQMSYTVPVVGGLFAEAFEEVDEKFTKLRGLSDIRYTIDKDISEEYENGEYNYEVAEGGHILDSSDISYISDMGDEEFEEEYDYYEVYS